MNQLDKRISLTLALAGTLALAACDKPAPTPAAPPPAAPAAVEPAPAPAPAPAAVEVPAAQVSTVLLGNSVGTDGKITAPTGSFGRKDTLYANVTIVTTQPNVSVGMRWKYQDGQTVADNAKTIAEAGTNVVNDKLTKPSGWPVGNYTLDVVSDGKTLSTTTFDVK